MTKKERIEAVLNEAPYVMTDADKREFLKGLADVLKAIDKATEAIGILNDTFEDRDSRELREFNIVMGDKINKVEHDMFSYAITYAQENFKYGMMAFSEFYDA